MYQYKRNFINKVTLFGCLIAALALVLLVTWAKPVQAEDLQTEDLFSIDIETLMNIEIISASKKTQKAVDSPIPVIVIDEEEISLSGAGNIPELLRRVAGVGVLSVSASDHHVGIRGFNQDVSRTLLVMIDGRSVYLDFYGMVLWDALPISMEEIRRIELVKGPGSSIYGGDAFNGVINIITKSPEEISGTVLSASAGEQDSFTGSLMFGKKEDNLGYKIAFSRDEYDEWEENDSRRYSTSGNFAVEKNTPRGSRLTLSGSIDQSKGETFTALDNFPRETTQSHLMLNMKGHDDLNVKVFWSGLDVTIAGERVLRNLSSVFTKYEFDIDINTYDMEMTKLLKTGKAGSLLIGGSYRHNDLDSDLLGGTHSQNIYGLFIEDEMELGDKTRALLGGRYDHHPLVKGNFSPRLGLVYALRENHHARLSYTTAYSQPKFTQSYLYVERIGADPIVGNKDLDVERIQSWNIGYSGLYRNFIELQVDMFHNRISGFIRWPEDPNAEYEYSNRDDFDVWGGEFSLKVQATDKLDLLLSYAYLDIELSNRKAPFAEEPTSKLNAGLNYTSEKIFGSLFAHYVSETRWVSYATSLSAEHGYEFHEVVDDYTIVNANIGYHLNRDLKLSLSGTNLFDTKHREFCMGDRIGRRVMGKATYSF